MEKDIVLSVSSPAKTWINIRKTLLMNSYKSNDRLNNISLNHDSNSNFVLKENVRGFDNHRVNGVDYS